MGATDEFASVRRLIETSRRAAGQDRIEEAYAALLRAWMILASMGDEMLVVGDRDEDSIVSSYLEAEKTIQSAATGSAWQTVAAAALCGDGPAGETLWWEIPEGSFGAGHLMGVWTHGHCVAGETERRLILSGLWGAGRRLNGAVLVCGDARIFEIMSQRGMAGAEAISATEHDSYVADLWLRRRGTIPLSAVVQAARRLHTASRGHRREIHETVATGGVKGERGIT